MDIKRQKSKPNWFSKKIVLAGAFAISVVWGVVAIGSASNTVSASSVLLANVESGKFGIDVRGIGTLVPKEVHWVATEVMGRVERVYIKAGAAVKKGDVLIKLENPILNQELEAMEWELEEVKAQLNAETVSLESRLLDQEMLVETSKLNYEGALLTLNAQKTLFEREIYTISSLEHERVKIEVKQFEQNLKVERKRLDKAKENFVAQKMAFNARLQRLQRQVSRAKRLVTQLEIRASIDSVVQEMPLELGQQVSLGENVAKLAKNDEFIAEVRVPEKQIYQVALNQNVTVDTKTTKVAGKVIRIDPAVVNGSVQVDIELVGAIPNEARPELTVDGIIHVANIQNTLFIQRPMFAKANTSAQVYLVNESTKEVELKQVAFGRASQTHIEIKQGLNPGEQIVISDVSNWQDKQISAIQ